MEEFNEQVMNQLEEQQSLWPAEACSSLLGTHSFPPLNSVLFTQTPFPSVSAVPHSPQPPVIYFSQNRFLWISGFVGLLLLVVCISLFTSTLLKISDTLQQISSRDQSHLQQFSQSYSEVARDIQKMKEQLASFQKYQAKDIRVLQENFSPFTIENFSEEFLVLQQVSQMQQKISPDVPVGTFMLFIGSEKEIPEGWLLCNGQELNRQDYTKLFQALGVAPENENRMTFHLPNMDQTIQWTSEVTVSESKNEQKKPGPVSWHFVVKSK